MTKCDLWNELVAVLAVGGKGGNKEEVECCAASLRPSRVSDGRHLVLVLHLPEM